MDVVTKRSMSFLLSLCWTACSVLAAEGDAKTGEANLIENPAFEMTDELGRAPGWEGIDGQAAAIDPSTRHSGTQSVRLSFKSGGFVTVRSRKVHLHPTRRYVISWWCKTKNVSNGSRAYLFLQYEDRQVLLHGSELEFTSDWRPGQLEYITPDRSETAQLVLTTQGRNPPSDKDAHAWFDDVSLVDAGPPFTLPPDQCPLTRGRWEIIPELSDEFDGSELDLEKWEVSDWAWPKTRTYYTPKNVTVSGGALHIALKKGTAPDKPAIKYTSGMIATMAKTRYGYFEAKCKLTRALANNAFWLYAIPRMGYGLSEIDIFESAATERTDAYDPRLFPLANKVNSCLHWRRPVDEQNMTSGAKRWQAPCVLDEEPHRYGLEWTDEHILIYFDGRIVNAFENQHHHYPLNVRFNLTAGFGGWPKDTDLPSSFDIDYVRAWRRLDVEDKGIWEYAFSLPDPKETYSLPTQGEGEITLSTAANGWLALEYRDEALFKNSKAIALTHTAVIQDKSGKRVNVRFEWRRKPYETGGNTYYGTWLVHRLDIDPAITKPRGTNETFTFVTRSGKEVQLIVTF